MADLKTQITELAQIMEEFGLEEAKLKGSDWLIEFSMSGAPAMSTNFVLPSTHEEPVRPRRQPSAQVQDATPQGMAIPSPMTGIFYAAPNPSDPPFVKEGDVIAPGQVIGLIEAMKVFNEVTAAIGGKVHKVAVESGQLVQQGDALIHVG